MKEYGSCSCTRYAVPHRSVGRGGVNGATEPAIRGRKTDLLCGMAQVLAHEYIRGEAETSLVLCTADMQDMYHLGGMHSALTCLMRGMHLFSTHAVLILRRVACQLTTSGLLHPASTLCGSEHATYSIFLSSIPLFTR